MLQINWFMQLGFSKSRYFSTAFYKNWQNDLIDTCWTFFICKRPIKNFQNQTSQSKIKISSKSWSCCLEVFCRKMYLKISQNSQEDTCARVSFLIKLHASACNFIKKETLPLVLSCEFCEISKNTLFCRTPTVAASEKGHLLI